jgi:hypothetical protein
MKDHLINLLYEQFKFNCFIHHFNSIGIKISQFEVNNNQIVLDIIGFPQNGIIESDVGPDCNTYNRHQLDVYLSEIIIRMVEDKEIVLTNRGLQISENYELFVKSELAKYIDMLLKELDKPDIREQDFHLDNGQNNLPLNLRCPRMTSVLHIHFERIFETKGDFDFKIYNPLVLPMEGECIDFEWSNFLDNEDFIKELQDFREDDVWVCNIRSRTYYKNQIETHIGLIDSKYYKEYLKNMEF